MIKEQCPTCGSQVKVSNSDEGTGYFVPVITLELVERIKVALNESLDACEHILSSDEAHINKVIAKTYREEIESILEVLP